MNAARCSHLHGILLALTLLVAACHVTAPYKKPEMPVPEHFQTTSAPQAADLSQWWQGFADPELKELVAKALQSNLDLKSAASRIRQAREQAVIAGAARLPSVNVAGAGGRLYSKSDPLAALGGGGAMAGAASGSTNLHEYALSLDASWEIDLFGGVQSAIDAANANTEAQEWQLRDGEVSLTAEVANDYLSLRALQERRALTKTSIEHHEELLGLAAARAHAGLASELDINQERSALSREQAQLPALEAEAGAATNALAVLLGEAPDTLQTEFKSQPDTQEEAAALGYELPAGLPSDLLRRRPDVRAAERRLAAASADVGVAVAKLYPSFDLIAAASLASSSPGNLLAARNFAALGIGDVMWPVFAGGRLRANVRASEEARTQAYLAYQGAVLAALQDAENAIIRCATEARRLESLQRDAAAAGSTLHIAEDEYDSGIVDFTIVLSADATDLDARDALVQSRQALAQARIALYKALGGGWRATESALAVD